MMNGLNLVSSRRKAMKLGAAGVAAMTVPASFTTPARAQVNEMYHWTRGPSTLPLLLTHDHPALKAEAEKLGVQIEFHGPTGIDIEAQNDILQQVAATKPAGIMFMPFGEGHNETINSVMAGGIPLY